MTYGTGTKSEFDDVRHGYAPPRQHNRAVPAAYPETRDDDIEFGFVDEPFQQSGVAPEGLPQPQPVTDGEEPDRQADTLTNSVHALIDSGKAAYEAEIALFKARADVISSSAKGAIVYVSIAAGAGLVTLLALGFGAIIVLGEYMPKGVAVMLVVLVLAAISAIAARFAKREFDRITTAIWDRTDG